MKIQRWVLVLLVMLLASGCGGSAGYGGGYAAKSAPAESQSYGSGDDFGQPGQPAPAPGSAPASESATAGGEGRALDAEQAPSADERPGLGTSWGETRNSRVTTAPFVREDPSRPLAVAQIFYNDEAGVRAMARRAGRSSFGDDGVVTAAGRGLSIRLLDGSHRALPALDTGNRTYVVGENGGRYIIQIRNHTGNRVEAVTTVDGLDVIDGRMGSFSKRGYIVNPFSTVEIDGFRQSTESVAAFRFGSVRGSYANRKGEDRNVGVIGVAFFQESGSRWPWNDGEVDRRHDADPFPGRFATPPN